MELFPSNKSLAWSRKTFAITLAMALALIFAVNRSALADTFWSNTAPTSVSDLMPGEYWTNGAPTSTNNSGYITGKTLTVTSDFKPGADGQDVDLTFGQGSDVTMNNAFIPLANLDSGQKGTVTFQLTGNANLYVGGNFWGGIDNDSREYSLNEDEYLLNQYYGGDSTFSSNEWWSAMSVKTYMKISDNAAVIARGGNSGLGWDDSAYGSKLELTDHGALTVNSTNMSIWGKDTTVNMYDHSTFSANTMNVSNQTPQINLYGNSKLTVHNTLTLDDKAAVSVNGNATLTVANDCSFDKNGSMTVNDNAEAYFNRYLRIGYSNNGEKGGAVFTQTGGTVTVSFDTYFSFHSDATINLAGGQFICHSSETYVTDQKDCKADINMSGDGYLQVNDLRLSQHGHTTLIMEDNSQIKASKVVNVAFNFSDEDHVVNKNTLNDSANITSNSMVFFGNNIDSSAYASITLNDDSTIAIANDVKVGLGSTTSPLGDNDYAAEITLNNNSKFSTKTFTTTVGAKSATTVNGSAIFEAETITIADGSFLNVNGGTVNVTSLINEGTVNLKGGAITLTPYGLITSTAGTFKATSGAVNVTVPAGVTYTDGDQMIVGFFGDDATASAVSGQTVVPEDWQKSVISMGESKKAVVASYGDTVPTSVKIWTGNAGAGDTSEGNPDNWLSDAGNPTGYVLEGTNAISGISGKTVFLGGDNTLSGDTPYDATLSINGGTVQYNNAIVRGNLLMNGGTFTDIGELRIGDLTEVKNGDNTEYVNYPAVFTQTDGVFTATATTFFSFHADATVNLSGGQCIIQGGQLYVTDQRGCTGDISMTNDSYLQAKDLRLSQH
ncbi:MAG: hypothetical protein IKW80_09565, partial [Thermoguttaceae bacterium]|nr:hypothetical protein [Thermoguttaceae bacterium]